MKKQTKDLHTCLRLLVFRALTRPKQILCDGTPALGRTILSLEFVESAVA